MTLDELLDSLPLKPWDKDDPAPLVQLAGAGQAAGCTP